MKPNCLAGLLATLLCLGSVFSTQAAATGKCEYWSAGGYPRTEIFGLPTSVVLPAERYDWTIDGVGAGSANILASATVVPADDGRFPSHAAGPYDKPYLLCDSAAGNWTQEVLLEGFGPPIWATFPPIYESGVDGVGIRARSGFRGNWLPYIANYDRVSGVIDSQLWFYWTVQRFVVELVAIKKLPHTGTQELGMTRPGSVVINYKQGGAGPDLRPLTLLLSPIRILRGSCTVPDTTVEMGQIPLSSFDAPDAASRAGKPFQIALNCSGAMKIGFFLSSSHIQDSAQGLIALDPLPNSAQNIGLQIQNENGDAIPLNTWQSTLTADAGLFPIKFRAQYRRLQPGAITAGTANATATITMQYR